ncbi:MAG: periplasmic heavy metal sensor [Rhizomicrobium sp.]
MDETRPRRNWLLIASLCLNVALIAGVAVVAWRIAQFDIAVGSGGPMSPRAVMAQFPDRRDAIRAIVEAHRGRIVALRRDAAQARLAAFREFGAPDATPQKTAAALQSVAAADAAVEREAVDLAAESLATLSPAQRQALVARIETRSHSWFFRLFRRGAR